MVSEHQQGLRFDIYERVHLSEGALGIKELDEVELVPHIQVLPQGEQAVLRGNLLLSGKYVDEQDNANRTLEHLIPVEITLPMNRVARVEDISVDIENFDVDLLSTRSLNVTGVLSLSGLEIAPSPQEEWRETEEEVVFVHQAEEPPAFAVEAFDDEAAQTEEQELFRKRHTGGEAAAESTPAATGEPSVAVQAETEETAQIAVVAEPEEVSEPEAAAVMAGPESLVLAPEPAVEEKKELKIAFAGKAASEAEIPVKTYGLKSLIHNSASAAASTEREEQGERPKAPPEDAVEWKKVLLSTVPDQREFRRMRLVIVQKDETLETIAQRYNLSPREIALHNRLAEQEVAAGQIIYLPK